MAGNMHRSILQIIKASIHLLNAQMNSNLVVEIDHDNPHFLDQTLQIVQPSSTITEEWIKIKLLMW